MRVIICGNRNWHDLSLIEQIMVSLPKDTVIIEGECRGADLLAKRVAEKNGYIVIPCPADWQKYGNAAGPIRNQKMLDEYKPDLVLAFHNDIEHSKGTKDMIIRADKANIPVRIIGENNKEWIYDSEHKEFIDISCDNPKLRKLLKESVKIK